MCLFSWIFYFRLVDVHAPYMTEFYNPFSGALAAKTVKL